MKLLFGIFQFNFRLKRNKILNRYSKAIQIFNFIEKLPY